MLLFPTSEVDKCYTQVYNKLLVHSFVTSKVDNGNSLIYGLPSYVINKLQMVQHAAARVTCIAHTRKFDSITPALRELHWLPVHRRIIFKLLVRTIGPFHVGLLHLAICQLYSTVINHPRR